MRVHLDYETRCELDLGKVGLKRYTSHPSFRVLMASWAIEDDPVSVVDMLDDDWDELLRLLYSPHVQWHAFNASFEDAVTQAAFGIEVPLERWHCTLVHAYGRGFAGKLGKVGAQMGFEQDKLKSAEGTRLIGQFSCPPFVEPWEDPDKWERFRDYCVQDVVAEREIWRFLARMPETRRERDLWVLDQKINRRGLPVDVDLATQAIALNARLVDEAFEEMKQITGLANPGSVSQLLGWLNTVGEAPLPNLQKATVEEALLK